MFDRGVGQLADKANRHLFPIGAGDRKTNRIPVTPLRKMRTGGRITKVAEFPYMVVGGRQFLTRSAAFPLHPAPSGRREGCGQDPSLTISRGTKNGQAKWVSRRTAIVARDMTGMP